MNTTSCESTNIFSNVSSFFSHDMTSNIRWLHYREGKINTDSKKWEVLARSTKMSCTPLPVDDDPVELSQRKSHVHMFCLLKIIDMSATAMFCVQRLIFSAMRSPTRTPAPRNWFPSRWTSPPPCKIPRNCFCKNYFSNNFIILLQF